jgi:hypothetical protein
MKKLTVFDLYSLEQYHGVRAEFRERVIAHKRNRQVHVGPHATLYFEDRLTMQYQIQEMLRVERIFEREAIEEELATYNPLIPDGTNLKATFMIEYADAEQRRQALLDLAGIEDHVYARVSSFDRILAHADEDLERTDAGKTAAVHFLRFELPGDLRTALKAGGELTFGIDHPHYRHETTIGVPVRMALLADLD